MTLQIKTIHKDSFMGYVMYARSSSRFLYAVIAMKEYESKLNFAYFKGHSNFWKKNGGNDKINA